MRTIASFLVLIFLTACAAPKFSGNSIEDTTPPVLVVEDSATKKGFLQTIKNWLGKNSIAYKVTEDGSKHNPENLTIEYEGQWGWDLALYLKNARIEAFNEGQRVGEVHYRVPYTANPSKFSVAEERIETMMDFLFGKKSLKEANQSIHSSK